MRCLCREKWRKVQSKWVYPAGLKPLSVEGEGASRTRICDIRTSMYQSGVLLANASTDQDLLEPVMIPNCLTILMATNKVWCLYGRAHDCDTWDDIISAARRRSNIGISSACDTSEQAKQADTPLAASTAQNRPMHRTAAYSSFLYDLSVLTGEFICTTRTQPLQGYTCY